MASLIAKQPKDTKKQTTVSLSGKVLADLELYRRSRGPGCLRLSVRRKRRSRWPACGRRSMLVR
jgi:hypothetical protein